MRALHTVVGTMTKDHSPGLIISWFSSASLVALTKEDGSHRPVQFERLFDASQRKPCSAHRSWSSGPPMAWKPPSTSSDHGYRATATTKDDTFSPWTWRARSTRLTSPASCAKSDVSRPHWPGTVTCATRDYSTKGEHAEGENAALS